MKKKNEDAKVAVALKYKQKQDQAPKVVASGKGTIAERIIEEAEKCGVPLYEDPELAALLAALPLEREIPPELYESVAKILAFIYNLDQQKGLLSK